MQCCSLRVIGLVLCARFLPPPFWVFRNPVNRKNLVLLQKGSLALVLLQRIVAGQGRFGGKRQRGPTCQARDTAACMASICHGQDVRTRTRRRLCLVAAFRPPEPKAQRQSCGARAPPLCSRMIYAKAHGLHTTSRQLPWMSHRNLSLPLQVLFPQHGLQQRLHTRRAQPQLRVAQAPDVLLAMLVHVSAAKASASLANILSSRGGEGYRECQCHERSSFIITVAEQCL
jgi:hypothetical protein